MNESITTPTLVPEVMALEAAAARIRNRYENTSNTHEDVRISLTLGMSGLAKKTARECWRDIMVEQNVPKRMAFIGNALGDAGLVDFEHKETRFMWPLGYGKWMISGSTDALDMAPIEDKHYVVAIEHKSHETMSKDKIEVARRQGMGCLAIAWRNAKAGNMGPWAPSPWAADNESFTWPAGAVPAGVVVALSPTKPEDGQLHTFVVSPADCDKALDFYIAKAIAIAKSVESGNPDEADAWDNSVMGVQEFPFKFEEIGNHEVAGLSDLIKKRDGLTDSAAHIKDELERLNADIETAMVTAGVSKMNVDGRTVSLVQQPECHMDYMRKPFTQIRVGKAKGA